MFKVEPHLAFEPTTEIPISAQAFEQATGYQLDYPLFFSNSFSGWRHDASTQMRFQASCQCYQVSGIELNKPQVDSWGTRFKIASKNWQHEFSFASAHDTAEQAKFGIAEAGSIIELNHRTYASDMYFELPPHSVQNVSEKTLSAQLKILSLSETPKAWLKIWYEPKPSL